MNVFHQTKDLNPTPQLLSLPPEIRAKIYEYLHPAIVQPTDYAGLRRACRLIQQEFDHEAYKSAQREFKFLVATLAEQNILVLSSLRSTIDSSILNLELPELLLYPAAALDPEIIPWHWSWLRKVIITFDANCSPVHQSIGVWQNLVNQLNSLISLATVRYTGMFVSELSRRTTVETITPTWYNTPPHITVRTTRRQRALIAWYKIRDFGNSDRCWDYRNKHDEVGGLSALEWHRRSTRDKNLEDFVRIVMICVVCGIIVGAVNAVVSAAAVSDVIFTATSGFLDWLDQILVLFGFRKQALPWHSGWT